MAITLDTIVNKVFKVVKNGYDNNEVESFLDEILEEMENREAETNKLKEQVAQLTAELNQATCRSCRRLRRRKPRRLSLRRLPVAPAPRSGMTVIPARALSWFSARRRAHMRKSSTAADTRAAEIINKANQDAAAIRSDAQTKIADLTAQLASLRKQTAEYYDSLKKITDAQTASMEQIKKLL